MISIRRIKDLREDKDKTQKEIAKLLNVSRSTYSLWELGYNMFPISILCILSDYYNCSIDYMLNISNEKKMNTYTHQDFDYKILGQKLKEIRIKNGYTEQDVANILYLSQAVINKYEKAKCKVPLDVLYNYAINFNVSLDFLCCAKVKIKIDS